MKKLVMLLPLTVAAFLLPGSAEAQKKPFSARLMQVQYVVSPPVFPYSCAVNGVTYGVDAYSRIWDQNAYGWFIIGRIVATPSGYIAVRNDGMRFPAVCQ